MKFPWFRKKAETKLPQEKEPVLPKPQFPKELDITNELLIKETPKLYFGQIREVTDDEWKRISSLLSPQRARVGRPSHDDRRAFNGILWMFRDKGILWKDLPKEYGSVMAVHKKLQLWLKDDFFRLMWEAFTSGMPLLERMRTWNRIYYNINYYKTQKTIGGMRRSRMSQKPSKRQYKAWGKEAMKNFDPTVPPKYYKRRIVP